MKILRLDRTVEDNLYQKQVVEYFLNNKDRFDLSKCLVFSSSKNITKKSLMKILKNVCARVNRKINKRSKYCNDNNRVKFFDCYQYKNNNTHAHTFIHLPYDLCLRDFNSEYIYKLIMNEFIKLDSKRHRVHIDDTRDVFDLVDYNTREITKDVNNEHHISYDYH